jgi:hydrogenase/urease accessory protein HupE
MMPFMFPRFAARFRLAIALFALVVWASPAAAHPAPFSYLDLVFRDGRIDGTLVVHIIDAAHDLGITPPERLLDNAVAERERQRLASILAPRLQLTTDHRLLPQWTSLELLRDDMALKLKFTVPREGSGALSIDTNLFPYDPLHQTFVNIYEGGDLRQQVIFNASSPEHTYYLGTTEGAIAVMKTFIPSGIRHILIGPDHILFLVGLLLLGGPWTALLKIVTAFTVGHSITLSLAALDLVTPPPTIIEPAIALSIVFVGADNLVRGNGRDLRAWAAATFGLVHGFGFANVLREFGLPREALGWSLFSFNVGVEIGQLGIVLLVASALAAIRRRSDAVGYRVAYAGSLVVIAAGTYWFVQRVFFPGGA